MGKDKVKHKPKSKPKDNGKGKDNGKSPSQKGHAGQSCSSFIDYVSSSVTDRQHSINSYAQDPIDANPPYTHYSIGNSMAAHTYTIGRHFPAFDAAFSPDDQPYNQ